MNIAQYAELISKNQMSEFINEVTLMLDQGYDDETYVCIVFYPDHHPDHSESIKSIQVVSSGYPNSFTLKEVSEFSYPEFVHETRVLNESERTKAFGRLYLPTLMQMLDHRNKKYGREIKQLREKARLLRARY